MKKIKQAIFKALDSISYLTKVGNELWEYKHQRYTYDDRLELDMVQELVDAGEDWQHEFYYKALPGALPYAYVTEQIWVDVKEKLSKTLTEEEIDKAEDYLYDHLDDHIQEEPADYLDDLVEVYVIVGTPEDQNHEFTLNGSYDWGLEDWLDFLENDELSDHSTLVWLLEQQGYTKQDFISNFKKDEDTLDIPITMESIFYELMNVTSYMNAVTFLGRMPIEDFIVANVEGKDIKISKGTDTGLFDTWQGGGSTFEIYLGKDIIVPSNMIYKVGLAYLRGGSYGYTPQDVYGFTRNVYKNEIEVI